LAENKNWINGSPSWHESKLIGVDIYSFSDTPFNQTFVYFQCNFQQLDSSLSIRLIYFIYMSIH